MKFGLPTLVECDGLKECVELASELSLSFIEINMSFPQYQVSNLNIDELIGYKREQGIFYTIHADEQMNPFDFNRDVSQCYFNIMREYIDFAKKLDIPVINMHLLKGVYVTLPGKVILLTDVYKDAYLERVREFIAMCEREIGDSGVKIAIENVDANPFTTSQLEAITLFMSSPCFALTLDIGHDTCLGGADRVVFDAHPDKLVHLHLHDSNGKSAHLPLGTANVDVQKTLSLLPEDGTCLVEVKTIAGLRESIAYLKDINVYK